MEYITVEGEIASILFSNQENGYTVLRLNTPDGVVTAAGSLPGVSTGERLLLQGSWSVHPQYGEQFKTESFRLRQPEGADEIYRYLAGGAIISLGPKRARDIVDKFGVMSLHVIENEPEELATVKGISLKSAMKISSDYRRRHDLRRFIEFLSRYGIKPLVATRVYQDYGDTALDAVRENPYILVQAPYHADFFLTDSLAFDLGFESDCPGRVAAAVVFELAHNLQNGHTFIPREKLTQATAEMIGVSREAIDTALEYLHELGDIVIEPVAGEDGCYLHQMREAEDYVARRISEMAAPHDPPAGIDEMIAQIELESDLWYADMQRQALKLAAESRVMALTGGPGTGKTTTVRGILAMFDALGLKTALCAPTGRAAKRLSETCDREAATIHRMLGTSMDETGLLVFTHDESNPLKADAVIVDEMSMVDLPLMRALIGALTQECRLIMVGDCDQLPPVGPGGVFADVLRSGVVPKTELTEIFRQARDSGIIHCAHSVNSGVMPDFAQKYPDMYFLKRSSDEELVETIAALVGERLPKNMGLEPAQIQVLTPTRRGQAGTGSLNEKLRDAVNPRTALTKEKRFGEFLFRVGDKVMQIRNNYDIMWQGSDGSGWGVYNGDIGMITEVDLTMETLQVDFEDKIVTYSFEQLPELEPAFAITVHKSQGSEYDAVVLALAGAAGRLLTRGVLYTAMTRAKSLLIIVGSPAVMERMIANDRRQRRYSGLRARLSDFAGL